MIGALVIAPVMTAVSETWRHIAHTSLDSTNAALKRMIAAGDALQEGLVVTAEQQTAGRGRQGRSWASPTGNLYASFLIKAPADVTTAPEIGFVAAVSVIDAFAAPGVRLRCKWPNDILAHGAKVCGILPELIDGWIVLGIGVNLRPIGIVGDYPITSLAEQGIVHTPDAALAAVGTTLSRRLTQWRAEGFAPIAAAWSAVGPSADESLSVRLPGATVVAGKFAGLDAGGALLLDTIQGMRRILAGDVLFGPALSPTGAG